MSCLRSSHTSANIFFGIFIQNRLGSGVYKGRTALIVTIIAAAVYILCGIVIYSSGINFPWMEKFCISAIYSIRGLSYFVLPIALAVLFRNKVAYRVTRPVLYN